MAKKIKSLFKPVVSESKLHPSFAFIMDSPHHTGCRQLMDEQFIKMGDKDGNFIEQFQTTGFDSRTFELGLFTVFESLGLEIDCSFHAPDFLVSDGTTEVWVEAVTSNPRDNDIYANTLMNIKELNKKEIEEKIQHEVPIRLGGPLYDKLKKKYWELEHFASKPLVFAIQPFHEAGSLLFPHTALVQYLLGWKPTSFTIENGELNIKYSKIENHVFGEKKIPSFFFGQPNTEFVTGVLFSNSLTIGKFTRMAFQQGLKPEGLSVFRSGTCYDPDPKATLPLKFSYELGTKDAIHETWQQGLVLTLNSSAEEVIPPFFFEDTSTYIYLDGEVLTGVYSEFEPFSSITNLLFSDDKITSNSKSDPTLTKT